MEEFLYLALNFVDLFNIINQMKKIYLLAFSLCVGSSLLAQVSVNGYHGKYKPTRENISPMSAARVDAASNGIGMRDVILEENFQGVTGTLPGALPAGWSTPDVLKTNGTTTDTSDDFNGPAFMVHDGTTANSGGYWPVTEVGSGNQFAGANDDGAPCDCVMTAVYVETPPVDFSTALYPAVTFDIYHDGNFGAGDASVTVSVDGGATWTQINYPGDANGVLPIEEGNWQTIVLTLFDYASFADVRIRFNWSDGDSWASGFGVDNVVIGDLEEYSLTMDKVVFGDWNQDTFGLGFWDYSMIPLSQTSPVHATAVVSNTGFYDLTDVNLEIEVMNGATSEGTWSTLSPDPLVSLTKDTLSVQADFIPSAVGQYHIMATTTSSAVEADLTDNEASAHFEMTDCTYARDQDGAQAFMELLSGEYGGNLFDIYQDETFGSIRFAIGAGSDVGGTITGFILDFGGFDANGDPIFEFVQGSETEEVTVYEEHLNSVNDNDFTCLPFVEPVTLLADHVYLVVISGSGTVRVPVSGSNVWVSSWLFTDNAYGATSGVPMIRLMGQCAEGCTVGVKEEVKGNVSLNQNMPNPASDVTMIYYTLNGSSKVTMSVRDIAGHLVEEFELGNKSIGSHNYQLNVSSYAPGVYSYTINAGSTNITRKMIVE